MDRQAFWQANYLHPSKINLMNTKWYSHWPRLICSRVPSHQNPKVFVAPSINSWVAGLSVFSRTILRIASFVHSWHLATLKIVSDLIDSLINASVLDFHCFNSWRLFTNILKWLKYFYSISLLIYKSKHFHYCFYWFLIISFIWYCNLVCNSVLHTYCEK